MAFDGNEAANNLLEDGDFEAVLVVTVDRNNRVNFFTRWRDPNRSKVSADIISKVAKMLGVSMDVANKYPI
jgi:hypothetical protein